MKTNLILATKSGVVFAEKEGDGWIELNRGLKGKEATEVIARGIDILAGTVEGVFRSQDLGHTWSPAKEGLTTRHIRSMYFYPGLEELVFSGTEPAGIFVSYDGGWTWRSCPEVAQLRDRHSWMLPYSPEAGCVRGFAFHGRQGYAAVEVGGVLGTNNAGENWNLVEGSHGEPDFDHKEGYVHADVHSIFVHPSSPKLVLAPTGGGLYLSQDGGKSWELIYSCYCRSAWWDPDNSDHIIFGPADSVDQNGRIEFTKDGGKNWNSASRGLQTPWEDYMVERFYLAREELLAVLSNGKLYSAPFSTLEWKPVLPDAGFIEALAVISDM
jgi:photosystem II stability/assembly factor-like uncharacterized protein